MTISLLWTLGRLTVHAPCLPAYLPSRVVSTRDMDLNVPSVPGTSLEVRSLFCHWGESVWKTPCSNLKHNRPGSGSLDTALQFQGSIRPSVHQTSRHLFAGPDSRRIGPLVTRHSAAWSELTDMVASIPWRLVVGDKHMYRR